MNVRGRIVIPFVAEIAAMCCTTPSAFGQAGENATLPLPPNPPPPGKGIPDFNGVWVMPYTPDLARPLKAPLPLQSLEPGPLRITSEGTIRTDSASPLGRRVCFTRPSPFKSYSCRNVDVSF